MRLRHSGCIGSSRSSRRSEENRIRAAARQRDPHGRGLPAGGDAERAGRLGPARDHRQDGEPRPGSHRQRHLRRRRSEDRQGHAGGPDHSAGRRQDRDRGQVWRQVDEDRPRQRSHDGELADQLRQPDRADLHEARLQRRRLPRQVGRPERLRPLAPRLRPRIRLPDPRQGKPRTSALPGQSRTQPAPHEGDRHHGPRRRQTDGSRFRRIQAGPPLDRLGGPVRFREGSDRRQGHGLPRESDPEPEQRPAVRGARPLFRWFHARRDPASPVRVERAGGRNR